MGNIVHGSRYIVSITIFSALKTHYAITALRNSMFAAYNQPKTFLKLDETRRVAVDG